MPYIEGKWGRIGLELGEAQERYKRDKLYREDKARAMAQTQEDLEASREAGTEMLGQMEQEQAAEAPGALEPGMQGPYSAQEQQVHDRFAIIKSIAGRMSPGNREQYLDEQREFLKTRALGRARKKVAEGVQDRFTRGGFNFLDETEPNEAIAGRVEQLMTLLDSDQVDPLKAAEMEGQILEVVRKENERRLEIQRGDAVIGDRLSKAVASGNRDAAQKLETVRAMWGTRELDFDDLTDRIFEAENGRKTARASQPNAYDVRKEAMRLVMSTGEDPTPENLQKYIDLLTPPEPRQSFAPLQALTKPIGYSTQFEQRGKKPSQGEVVRGVAQKAAEKGRVAAGGKPGAAPPKGKAPAAPAAKADTKKATTGGGGRSWKAVPAGEQKRAVSAIRKAMASGDDLAKLASRLKIDLESLPEEVIKELVAQAEKPMGRMSNAEAGTFP